MGRDDVGDGELLCHRGDGRTVFRLTHVERTSEDDWRSNFDRRSKPRKSEIGSALNQMALSMWLAEQQAIDVNQAFEGKLGSFVVTVELRGEEAIWFSETGSPGHVAVWGRPEGLQRCVLAARGV